MTEYVEYPITLSHPHFKAATSTPIPGSEIRGRNGDVIRQAYQGSPERFPPVVVNNEADEAYYASQGYERAGKMDPSAWVKAHSDVVPETYKPEQYPKWGKDADGKPVLYLTAQDDPDASAEDLAPKGEEPAPAVVQAKVDAATVNALHAAEELARAKDDQIAAKDAENEALLKRIAELEAMKDKRTAPKREAA